MSVLKLCNNTGVREETNICFLNAALQALNSLDYFREFFVNRDYDPGSHQFPICDEIPGGLNRLYYILKLFLVICCEGSAFLV